MKVIFSFSVVYIDESTNRDYSTLSSHFPWSEVLLKNLVENNKTEQNLLHDMKLCIVFFVSYWFLVFRQQKKEERKNDDIQNNPHKN
jgi:hypothetical protein